VHVGACRQLGDLDGAPHLLAGARGGEVDVRGRPLRVPGGGTPRHRPHLGTGPLTGVGDEERTVGGVEPDAVLGEGDRDRDLAAGDGSGGRHAGPRVLEHVAVEAAEPGEGGSRTAQASDLDPDHRRAGAGRHRVGGGDPTREPGVEQVVPGARRGHAEVRECLRVGAESEVAAIHPRPGAARIAVGGRDGHRVGGGVGGEEPATRREGVELRRPSVPDVDVDGGPVLQPREGLPRGQPDRGHRDAGPAGELRGPAAAEALDGRAQHRQRLAPVLTHDLGPTPHEECRAHDRGEDRAGSGDAASVPTPTPHG